jgi:hypothetical protein
MCAGYTVDNLGSSSIGETLPSKKKYYASSTLYRGGRLMDKLIVKLGLLQLVSEHLVAVSGIEILM